MAQCRRLEDGVGSRKITGLIDPQITRDVFSGDEVAYSAFAESVSVGRGGTPEEIANAVLRLCSSAASYVVGHDLTIDGGMTVG